jgi:hypothetical protein
MTRRTLRQSSALATGMAMYDPVVTQILDIRSLPEIDRDALPGIPADMTAYLRGGDPPVIVLYHRSSQMHIEVPIPARHDLTLFIALLREAESRKGMGEPPEAGGYSFPAPEATGT